MQEGFDSMDLARGLESGSGTPESESERALPAIGAQDMVDVRRGEEGRGRERKGGGGYGKKFTDVHAPWQFGN